MARTYSRDLPVSRTYRIKHRSGFLPKGSTRETVTTSLITRSSTSMGIKRVLNNLLDSAVEIFEVEVV